LILFGSWLNSAALPNSGIFPPEQRNFSADQWNTAEFRGSTAGLGIKPTGSDQRLQRYLFDIRTQQFFGIFCAVATALPGRVFADRIA
jgi:hypothetical protein